MSWKGDDPSPITELLHAWERGEPRALDELLPQVHATLARVAQSYLAKERTGHTLQTQALVNEAFLKLLDQKRVTWRDRTHFFAVAAQAMRRILVDHARSRASAKRGHGAVRISVDDIHPSVPAPEVELLALDEALVELARDEPERARLVELRFFAGLTKTELAETLGISTATVTRRWRTTRLWLFDRIAQEPS